MNLEDKERWQNQIGSAEKKMKNTINEIKLLFGAFGVFFLLICFQIWHILTGRE